MTRRHVLSAFAGATTVGRGLLRAAPGPRRCPDDPPKPNRVNVIFHGTFVFSLYDAGITAAAPDVPGHTYGIGVWGQEVNLGEGAYKLSFEDAKPKTMPANCTSVFSGSKPRYLVLQRSVVGAPQAGLCWMDLPWPDYIVGLRYASDPQFFLPGNTIGSSQPTVLPIITVLRYLRNPRTLRFSPAGTWQRPPGVCNKLNVHVFADPGLLSGEEDHHPSMAMDAINRLFWNPLDLAINPDADTSGYIDDDLDGDVPRWEQLGLGERFTGKAASISNCLAVAVTA